MFQKLFGSSKAEPPQKASQDIAAVIQRIQGVVELLEKKSDFLSKKITTEITEAKVGPSWCLSRHLCLDRDQI